VSESARIWAAGPVATNSISDACSSIKSIPKALKDGVSWEKEALGRCRFELTEEGGKEGTDEAADSEGAPVFFELLISWTLICGALAIKDLLRRGALRSIELDGLRPAVESGGDAIAAVSGVDLGRKEDGVLEEGESKQIRAK
jgi:hypothetical protein